MTTSRETSYHMLERSWDLTAPLVPNSILTLTSQTYVSSQQIFSLHSKNFHTLTVRSVFRAASSCQLPT